MTTDDHGTDWNEAQPAHIPEPTYWPMFLAAGIVMLAYSFVSSWWYTGLGVVLFAVALAGWIGELRHERR